MSIGFCFFFFFFSSRRRHTRCYRDWSSDVCSSDLRRRAAPGARRGFGHPGTRRRSEERRVGKSVDLGGRRIIKKKKKIKKKKRKTKVSSRPRPDKVENGH